jgi:hypothetical protein
MRASRLAPSVVALSMTALVGLATAGCSSGTHASAAQPTTTPGTATAAATASALTAKLLTAADLPAGWARDASATNPAMATACPVLNPTVWNGPLPGHVEANLSAGLTGPFLVEQIAGGDAQQVAKAWGTFVAAIPQCTTFTHSGSSGSSSFSITKADLPTYGDGSYGFGLSIEVTGGVSASGNVVVARTGDAVVLIYVVGIPSVSVALAEQIVAKAVAKA